MPLRYGLFRRPGPPIQSVAAKLIAKGGAETCYLNVSGDPFSRLSGSQSQVIIKAFSGC